MGIAVPLFTAIYLNNKGKGNSWLKHATRSLIGSSTSLGYILQKFYHTHNRRQNELRRFTLKGLFDIFLTSKEENIAFPPPSAPCNVVPLLKLPLENNKQPNFEWRGQGRGVHGFLCSLKLPYLSTISQQFCCRLIAAVGKWWLVLLDHPIITTHNLTKNLISLALKSG